MRLLIFGHHSHTGFGTVTHELATRFLAAGVDVRILAVNHRGEPVTGDLAGRVWPANMFGEPFGGNLSAAAISGGLWSKLDRTDAWRPDAVLCIADVSGLLEFMGRVTPEVVALWQSLPVYHYCPIEGDNLPETWKALWEMVRPVAMSDYGRKVISNHIGRAVPRIYHGVDTETFRPVSFADPIRIADKVLTTKEACKAHFGLAGRKVLLRTDRNVVRKFYYRLLQAFVPIAQADPDATLLMHCRPIDVEGIDLIAEIARLPDEIRNGGRMFFTSNDKDFAHDTFVGLSQPELVALYNAADVYVTTTGGEGFGLTIAEALACEVPVVSTGWAAEVEVIGPGGITVSPLRDTYGDIVRHHSSYGMDWAIPDPRAFTEPVLSLLSRPSRRRAMGAAGREHVLRSFNWDTAAAEFLALFEEADAVAA